MKHFTREKIQPYIDKGLVSFQRHPEGHPLTLYNYTHKCQYEREWDEITMNCRGLVLSDDNEIIVRGFPKFFNVGEYPHDDKRLMVGHPEITEKKDGSLFLYGEYNGYPITCTRGSFSSEQAVVGRRLLRPAAFMVAEGTTLCFEVIYPENRIVVDYSGHSMLVLLDVIDNETGTVAEKAIRTDAFWAASDAGMPLRRPYTTEQYGTIIGDPLLQKNKEGFVFYFPKTDYRVKVKFEDYVRLHRIMTGLTSRKVWEMLKNDAPLDEYLKDVPDEFYQWVQNKIKELTEKFDAVYTESVSCYLGVYNELVKRDRDPHLTKNRGYFAEWVNGFIHEPAMYMHLDHQDARLGQYIWGQIKPPAEKPFTARPDEEA